MTLGLIGLGKMGTLIAERLHKKNITVITYDKQSTCDVSSIRELTQRVDTVWLMIPENNVDMALAEIIAAPGSVKTIIDGGNCFFQDSVRRHTQLKQHGIDFLDCGTSGGLDGETYGFSLTIGGDAHVYETAHQYFKAIAAPQGYAHVGPSGAGHYVKMIHNGIEYALLQAYAEGFNLLKNGAYDLDLAKIAQTWNHGAIIRSWILELVHDVLKSNPDISLVSGKIAGGQTGTWAYEEGKRQGIPLPLLQESLKLRHESQTTGGDYSTQLIALLRYRFGGHSLEQK